MVGDSGSSVRISLSTIIVRKSANNEIVLGCQALPEKTKNWGDKAGDRAQQKYIKAVADIEVCKVKLESGCQYLPLSGGGGFVSDYGVDEAVQDARRPLDIINEFQQSAKLKKNRGGWGFQARPTIFGKYARHTILEAGAILDKEYGQNIYEVTLTLPGSTMSAMQTLAAYSGYVCNLLIQIIRRHQPSAEWFYVWELQKRGALHMHFAIAASDISDAKLIAEQLEYRWFEILFTVGDKSGIDLFEKRDGSSWRDQPKVWQSHVARVYKSVAAYYSKYVGKCANASSIKPARSRVYYPARWWGMSAILKFKVKAARKKYAFNVSKTQEVEVLNLLRSWLADPSVVRSFGYEFEIKDKKKERILGSGWREVYYFESVGFERMCSWLEYKINEVKDILSASFPNCQVLDESWNQPKCSVFRPGWGSGLLSNGGHGEKARRLSVAAISPHDCGHGKWQAVRALLSPDGLRDSLVGNVCNSPLNADMTASMQTCPNNPSKSFSGVQLCLPIPGAL